MHMEFILVTGMSGAGKSIAVNALEDIGYYCIDNIPAALVSKFVQLCVTAGGSLNRVAMVVDIRGRELLADLSACLGELQEKELPYKLLYLDCENSVIHHRYKETRRKHPLQEEGTSMAQALEAERRFLEPARSRADYVIDTSLLKSAQLRDRVAAMFSTAGAITVVTCLSFGFKHGIPPEADLVFDLRSLPNPFYVLDLRDKRGVDREVADYVFSFPKAVELLGKVEDMTDFLVELAIDEGRSQFTVAFGCTGGHHRSVAFAEKLGDHLRLKNSRVVVDHRDLSK